MVRQVKFFDEPVLAIETSCDETSAAILIGDKVASNVIASQIEMHQKWGGVVPEAAARAHVEAILPVISTALSDANLTLKDIGGLAVTNRPGLVGALSVGVTTAKALSFSLGIPLVGVHHLEGHLLSALLDTPPAIFPHVALVVSGGHTELVKVSAPGQYELLGQTLDDAAGEAFDKGARLMGLGYPGGRAIQDAAVGGDPNRYPLPRSLPKDLLNFSFSGLKTAVLRLCEKEGSALNIADAAASLQEAIVAVLTTKTIRYLEGSSIGCLTLVGGVAANIALRERLRGECNKLGIQFSTPTYEYCTDNAAMIAVAGSIRLANGQSDGYGLDVFPNADLPS